MLAVQHISVKADYVQDYPYPTEKKYVNDYAGVIGETSEQYIVNAGEELEQKTGAQAVVVVIKSLQGNNLESYATGLFNEWGIGQQDKNNGLLILVAINDRKWRVEVGKGLENVISNTNSASTMEELAKPYFKESNYEEGIKSAYSFFAQTIAKNNNVTLNKVKSVKLHGKTILGFSPDIFMILLIVIFAGIFYSSRKHRISQRGNYYSDSNYYHNNF